MNKAPSFEWGREGRQCIHLFVNGSLECFRMSFSNMTTDRHTDGARPRSLPCWPARSLCGIVSLLFLCSLPPQPLSIPSSLHSPAWQLFSLLYLPDSPYRSNPDGATQVRNAGVSLGYPCVSVQLAHRCYHASGQL